MDRATENATAAQRDEAEIRALMSAWSAALETKDLDGLTAGYAPDVVLFDAKPPFRTAGPAAIRELWDACLPYFPERFTSEQRDLSVTVSGDVAFAHGLHAIRPVGDEPPLGNTWLRITVGYRRIHGRWRVVHEHVSVPWDPMTDQMVPITDSDL